MIVRKGIEEIVAESGRARRPVWIAVGGVLLAAVLLALWYLKNENAGNDAARYVTEEARIADVIVTVTATGTVEPTSQYEISSELSGTVVDVLVEDNDQVEEGQVLARLDTSKLDAAVLHAKAVLAQSQAHVREAQASLEEATDALDRNMSLYERSLVSRESYLSSRTAHVRAQAALESARAEVQVAEADLLVSESNLAKACICSPARGIVLESNLEPGQIVASSLQAPVLFTIAEDLAQMELRVDIDEADIGQVKVDDKATFSVDAWQSRTFPAAIAQIRYKPQTVNGVVTYKAILEIDNSELLLRPGMTANAQITVDQVRQALTIPNAALRFQLPVAGTEDRKRGSGLLGMIFSRPPSAAPVTRNDGPTTEERLVYVLKGESPEEVMIKTGVTDGQITQVIDGDLQPGDVVITDMEQSS